MLLSNKHKIESGQFGGTLNAINGEGAEIGSDI